MLAALAPPTLSAVEQAPAGPDSEIEVRRPALLSAVLAALLTGPLPAAVVAVLFSAPILGAAIGRRPA